MFHAGTCPKCEQGVRGFRTCGESPVLMCDECEAVWTAPDEATPTFPPQPDLPSPVSGRSLIGRASHWCSKDEISAADWSDAIEGEVASSSESSPGIDPLVVYFDDSNDDRSLDQWIAAAEADERFRVVRSGENQSDVELVIVDAEAARQAPHVSIALKAKKHVLARVPWGDIGETRQLVSVAEEENRSLGPLSQWRHHPRTRAIRSVIDSGAIGPVRRIIIGRSEPDNLGIESLLVEAVAAAIWACDCPPSSGATTALTADAATVTLEFDTAVALIDISDDLPKRQWIEIVGLSGSIVCDDFFEPIADTETRFWIHDKSSQSQTATVAPANGRLATLLNAFRQIRTGTIDSGETCADATEVALRLLQRDGDSEIA